MANSFTTKKIASLAVYVPLLCVSLPAFSASVGTEYRMPSSVNLASAYRDDSSSAFNMDMDLHVASGQRVYMAVGLDSDQHQKNTQYDMGSYLLGVASPPLSRWEIGADYESWGNAETDFSINALSFWARYNAEDWSVTLSPTHRQIGVDVNTVNNEQENEIDSQGYGLSVRYFGLRNFAASVRYYDYSYSQDVSALQIEPKMALRGNTVSHASYDLVRGIDDYKYAVDLTYYASSMSLGVGVERGISAIDATSVDAAAIYSILPIMGNWRATFEIGRQQQEDADKRNFGSVGLGYTW